VSRFYSRLVESSYIIPMPVQGHFDSMHLERGEYMRVRAVCQ